MRVLALDPTVSVHFYLVVTNIVSVIALCPPKVSPYSLVSLSPQQRFNVVVCLPFCRIQSMALVRFSMTFMGALILNSRPSCSIFLQYDECSPLWFCFRLLRLM